MKSVLAADWGGTKCRFGLVDENLQVHAARRIETPPDYETLVDETCRIFAELSAEPPGGTDSAVAIGVGTAGVIRFDGSAEESPNVPIGGRPVAHDLHARSGLPVTVLNDGRAAAWGEYLRGEAAGRDPLLVLFFGTGIGIGVVIGGEPMTGATNAAGEVGHTVHVVGGRRCSCGRRGCFEAYCGGGPMARRAEEEIGPPPGGASWRVADLVEMAAGDARAAAILADAERAAGALVASLCTLFNPAGVVLGGGVLADWPELRERIERFTRAWSRPIVLEDLRFFASSGGSDAILRGAAAATRALAVEPVRS